ncbi:MAG: hypothetical protein Q4B29_00805 [Candidatus Saccharibacteria bacterium]|nr:hypothetical protein [Candidatus Saccharibacteria bacterium]
MSEQEKDVTNETTATEITAPTENPEETALEKIIREYGGALNTSTALGKLGVENVEDLKMLTVEELCEAGFTLVKARKLLDSFKTDEKAEATLAPAAKIPTPVAPISIDILPNIPDEGSWLNSLKTGGVLKVNDATYIGAIRVAMASRCGLYDVPEKLLKKLEEHAESLDEPVGDDYYKTRKMITRRNYAEIFEAIDGVDGPYATTKERRSKFLKSLGSIFWPAIKKAFDELDAWYDSARASMSDPGVLFAAFSGQSIGGLGMSMPSVDAISSACDDLKDEINKVFRGTAIPVSAALAYDAQKINEVLSISTLPAQVGATNRDQMLKMLGVGINSSYTRQEQCIVRFVLSFLKFNDAAVGNEIQYLGALWQLGRQISWESLGMGTAGRVKSAGNNTYL